MAVEDRVAFALIFLSDSKLNIYFKKLVQQLTEDGSLAGFLVTGTKYFTKCTILLTKTGLLKILIIFHRS